MVRCYLPLAVRRWAASRASYPIGFGKGQRPIRELYWAINNRTGNLPPLPGIFPDYAAPVVRSGPDGRELPMARWGMPSPVFAQQGKKTDPGVTNVRNTKFSHWLARLG